ncbi:MAG TPA: zf-TFIIB domain-containing protein [Candidatus Saccharimonadales bacterium]|nr:zf-TFIIB domain-containing protein [Candidatus Saccharimonadales bacterium]
MKCPVDQTALTIADRQGIEIDFCPTCRGVWLDRGELDKLIERSGSFGPAPHQPEHREERHENYERPRYNDDEYHHSDHGKHHKKESFLGDFFDF